jgi:hypothetical protein
MSGRIPEPEYRCQASTAAETYHGRVSLTQDTGLSSDAGLAQFEYNYLISKGTC